MHVAVAPDELLIVTTVPIGNVRCAHVPGGAASYHVAPPLWLRPDGAGAVDAEPDDPDFGAGLAGAAAGLGAGFTVVAVRRATVVGGPVDFVARTRRATGVYAAAASVVGGAGATVVSGAATSSSTGAGCCGADAETVRAPLRTWGGDEDGGAAACIRASAGPPAIAAHKATGTARRVFLNARVVRTPPLLQNAGAARPPLHVLKRSQRRFGNSGEPMRGVLWIATSGKSDS